MDLQGQYAEPSKVGFGSCGLQAVGSCFFPHPLKVRLPFPSTDMDAGQSNRPPSSSKILKVVS